MWTAKKKKDDGGRTHERTHAVKRSFLSFLINLLLLCCSLGCHPQASSVQAAAAAVVMNLFRDNS